MPVKPETVAEELAKRLKAAKSVTLFEEVEDRHDSHFSTRITREPLSEDDRELIDAALRIPAQQQPVVWRWKHKHHAQGWTYQNEELGPNQYLDVQALYTGPLPPQERQSNGEPSRCKNTVAPGETMEPDTSTGDAPVVSGSALSQEAPVPHDSATPPLNDVEREMLAAIIVRAVAELPDRTSPADQPDAMLVTQDELFDIVCAALSAPRPAPSQEVKATE